MQTLSQISPLSPLASASSTQQQLQQQQHQQQPQEQSSLETFTSEIHQQPLVNSVNNLMPECQGCLCLIQDRYYLQVMEKAWHLNCLRCAECKFSLDSQQSCFSKDGVIYCKEDYYKWVFYWIFRLRSNANLGLIKAKEGEFKLFSKSKLSSSQTRFSACVYGGVSEKMNA